MRGMVIVVVCLGLAVPLVRAERPPEKREEADAILVGKVVQITTKETPFLGDGIRTDYTAEVTVTKAKKGEGVKAGDRVKVSWFHVTKPPSKPVPAAYGHGYKIKRGDEATFWLMRTAKKDFTVIYNSDGIEKVKK